LGIYNTGIERSEDMRNVCVAATQMSCTGNRLENLDKAEAMVRKAAGMGAQVILIQELFETLYFCQKENPNYYLEATSVTENPAVIRFKALAKELGVILPVSFYEKANNVFYNSVAMIDHLGNVMGVYRKTHIPDGPGYEEKYYFSPGDTGFKVWDTKYGKIGVGICWDQWFPESARCMALMGAELILYPTAIGSEPEYANIDSKAHWQCCMLGHAASNLVPVIASNRIGAETIEDSQITFYGSSFIAGPTGVLLQEADRTSETVLVETFDLDALAFQRAEWGVFRDRRPVHYGAILTLDGKR
jgi:N-carbamoylputrescine amidase